MAKCTICGQESDSIARVAEKFLIDFIKKSHPNWIEQNGACIKCIEYYNSLEKAVVIERGNKSSD